MTTFSAEGIPALVAPRILRPLVLAPIQCAFAAAASGNSSWPNQPARPDNDGIDPANVHFLDSFAEASLVVRVCRQGHPLVHAVTLIGHYLSVSCLYRREVVGREEFLGGLDRPSNEAPGFSGGAGDSSVVRFEATKYHTVAATDDRPEGRGLSLVFDQILRSSSARRMTRSIAS